MATSAGGMAKRDFSWTAVLFPANGHLSNLDGGRRNGAAEIQVGANGFETHEHLLQIPRDGDFGNREGQLAIADPESRRAARIITCDNVNAKAHQLGDVEAVGDSRNNLLRGLDAFFEIKV